MPTTSLYVGDDRGRQRDHPHIRRRTGRVSKPITSVSLAGVGERMILVPELMELGETAVEPLIKDYSQKIANSKRGVTILTPSRPAAEKWKDVANCPGTTEEVAREVRRMQASETFGPLVLANRYDGIDLPGQSCRFLVMAGLPRGTSDYDIYRAIVLADGAVNSLLAQRIEQGIGRGTRGAGDFCAVILMGNDLVAWIARTANLQILTSTTRVQLDIGHEISRSVKTVEEFRDTLLKCLKRRRLDQVSCRTIGDWSLKHPLILYNREHTIERLTPRYGFGEAGHEG